MTIETLLPIIFAAGYLAAHAKLTRTTLIAWFVLYAPATQACNEACWVDSWCQGDTEVVLESGKRVDCLTDTHAIEADWDGKWAEAFGQSIYYATQTGLKPGVLLLLDGHSTDRLNLDILQGLFTATGVSATIWAIDTSVEPFIEYPPIEVLPHDNAGCRIWGGNLTACAINHSEEEK